MEEDGKGWRDEKMKTQRIDPEDHKCIWRGVAIRAFQHPENYSRLRSGRLAMCYLNCNGFDSRCEFYWTQKDIDGEKIKWKKNLI